jgi:predicted transcriptional regulator
MRMADNANDELITLTADIVSAHVSNNAVDTGDIANLIAAVMERWTVWALPLSQQSPKGLKVRFRSDLRSSRMIWLAWSTASL